MGNAICSFGGRTHRCNSLLKICKIFRNTILQGKVEILHLPLTSAFAIVTVLRHRTAFDSIDVYIICNFHDKINAYDAKKTNHYNRCRTNGAIKCLND